MIHQGGSVDESLQMVSYKRFTEACRTGNVDVMRECVDPDVFSANFPGQGRLIFDQTVEYFARLRNVTLNFGSAVPRVIRTAEQDNTLYVRYGLTFTLASGYRLIELTSIDEITFQGGKIVEIYVVYDRLETNKQAFM